MNGQLPPGYRQIQVMGCLATAMVFAFLCLLPWLFVETMQLALSRLHLSGPVATLAVVGILLGSFFNFPIHAIQRDEEQVIDMAPMWGGTAWGPSVARRTTATYIAVNVGGCVVPSLIAIWQLRFLVSTGGWPLTAVAIVAGANIAVCYFVARPIRGIGIGMPWFTSPAVSVGLTWLLLGFGGDATLRAPVAFVAGVAGPLIGADLLHLRDITRVSARMLSIGGAGTFDGIVLSGILAALLA